MNNSQINTSIKFQTKSSPNIDKNKILNEFNNLHNLHKLKQVAKNINSDNNKSKEIEIISNNLNSKIISVNKFVNNNNNKAFHRSEPRKIISKTFRKIKGGLTFTGSLYNNKMESKFNFDLFLFKIIY